MVSYKILWLNAVVVWLFTALVVQSRINELQEEVNNLKYRLKLTEQIQKHKQNQLTN